MENQSPWRAADSQRFARWPRPAVWCSAKTTTPSSKVGVSICRRKSFVDRVDSKTMMRWPSSESRSAARKNVTSSCDMCQLQREIDRRCRVRERADRNEVDAGCRDLPDVLQVDATARFEFHFSLADRDRFAHFRGAHVVEQDDLNAIDFQKRANLIEIIGLDLDP